MNGVCAHNDMFRSDFSYCVDDFRDFQAVMHGHRSDEAMLDKSSPVGYFLLLFYRRSDGPIEWMSENEGDPVLLA